MGWMLSAQHVSIVIAQAYKSSRAETLIELFIDYMHVRINVSVLKSG